MEKPPIPLGRSSAVTLGCLLLALFSTPAVAAELYRYINERGYQEIGYSIPGHLVPNGYDVIDSSGRLVRRVAPQLSDEEYAAKIERERMREACERALDRVHRLYEKPSDIDAAERLYEKKVAESIRNDRANLERAQNELKRDQELAARRERMGEALSSELLGRIERRETEIRNLETQIEVRQKEVPVKAEEFDAERRLIAAGSCESENPVAKR